MIFKKSFITKSTKESKLIFNYSSAESEQADFHTGLEVLS